MEAPKQIKEAAEEMINQFGGVLVYLGKYHDMDAYTCQFGDDICVGFPTFYLFKDGVVSKVSGYDEPNIMNLLIDDFSEVSVK